MNHTTYKPKIEILTFCILFLSGIFIVFSRFKYNFLFPNFYAEDGKFFSREIYDGGLASIFKLFNGYYVLGLYLLTWLAERVNSFLGFNLAHLPRTISVVSYVFYSFVFNVHWLLMKRMSFLTKLLLSLMFFTVPLAPHQYEILGIIGNTKWIFAYLAFLLLCWQKSLCREDSKNWFAVFSILGCFYTLPTVIFLYPILFWHSVPFSRLWSGKRVNFNARLWSFLVLSGLSFFQIWATISNDHSIKGYLDGMLNRRELIEIVFARTILYGFSPQLYTRLNDVTAMLGTFLFLLSGLILLKGRHRNFFVLGFLFCLSLTSAFVLNRPGITQPPHFSNYTHGSYSRFFFTQNMICFLLFALVFDALIQAIHTQWKRLGLFVALCLFILANFVSVSGELKYSNFMAENIGDIYFQVSRLCSDKAESFLIPIYPTPDWKMPSSKTELCSSFLEINL